jgi:hypothetical protein
MHLYDAVGLADGQRGVECSRHEPCAVQWSDERRCTDSRQKGKRGETYYTPINTAGPGPAPAPAALPSSYRPLRLPFHLPLTPCVTPRSTPRGPALFKDSIPAAPLPSSNPTNPGSRGRREMKALFKGHCISVIYSGRLCFTLLYSPVPNSTAPPFFPSLYSTALYSTLLYTTVSKSYLAR